MSTRTDILLNECGDVKIVDGDTVVVGEADQIRQSWLIHIRTFMGELLTDVNKGVPWFQRVLEKRGNNAEVEQIFTEQTLLVPGVIRVNGVEVVVTDPSRRQYQITVDADIEGEDGAVFNYQGALPAGTCNNDTDDRYPLSVEGLIVWFDAQDLSELTYDPSTPYLRLENKGGTGYAIGTNNAPCKAQLVDGDMEASGTAAWSSGNSATVVKSTVNPQEGSQVLAVQDTGTLPAYAYQNAITIGCEYRLQGWARRRDGLPRITFRIWDGTTSLFSIGGPGSSWVAVDVTFTATSTELRFGYDGLTTSTNYADFDDMTLTATTPGGTGYPVLVGVSPLNNKRSIYLGNTVASGDTAYLEFYDTKALRPSKAFTVFYVGMILDDTGTYDYGLVAFRGQNDAGTEEESNWLTKVEASPTNPALRFYSKTAAGLAKDSEAALAAGQAFVPFYSAASVKQTGFTDFWHNGVKATGDASVLARYLDGDGFIGAGMNADCETPANIMYGYFGEMLVYERELTDSEIEQMGNWLAAKWGF